MKTFKPKTKYIDWELTPYNSKACIEKFLNEGGVIKTDKIMKSKSDAGVGFTREIKSRYS